MQACNLHSLFLYRSRPNVGCGGLGLPVVCTITDCWRGTEWLSRAGLLLVLCRTAWLLHGAGYDYPARMSMLRWPTPTWLLVTGGFRLTNPVHPYGLMPRFTNTAEDYSLFVVAAADRHRTILMRLGAGVRTVPATG